MGFIEQSEAAARMFPAMVEEEISVIRSLHEGHDFSELTNDGDLLHSLDCRTCGTKTELWRG